MKKILSAIIMLCLFLTALSPLALAADSEAKIISTTYTSEGNLFTLVINGISEPNSYVSLIIKNEIGIIKALEQCETSEEGVFSKEIVVNTSSDSDLCREDGSLVYTIFLRDYHNRSDQDTIPLYSETSKQMLIDNHFKSASNNTEMNECIMNYSKVFGFDMTHYTEMQSTISGYMLAGKERLTVENIVHYFNEAVIRSYLFNPDFEADRTRIIEYADYSAEINFVNGFAGAASLYPDYQAMTREQQKQVNSRAFKAENSAKPFVELKEIFFMAIIAEIFEEYRDDYSMIYNFLKEHNDWMEFNQFESLTTYNASQIINGLCSEEIPDNLSDFISLYNKYLNGLTGGGGIPVKPSTGGNKPSTGGGGGGGKAPYENIALPAPDDALPVVQINYFTDLDGFAWAREAIVALADRNIVNGKEENIFAPGDNITREEFAKILVLAYDLYDETANCDFLDVDSDRWSYRYIASAYKSGAVTGYPDGSFGTSNNITREEMAVMIYRVLLQQSKITSPNELNSKFNDYLSISAFAVNSVIALNNAGIVSGDDNGNFNPQNNATRAETCKIIYNSIIRSRDD